jgi:hypothetical protein
VGIVGTDFGTVRPADSRVVLGQYLGAEYGDTGKNQEWARELHDGEEFVLECITQTRATEVKGELICVFCYAGTIGTVTAWYVEGK